MNKYIRWFNQNLRDIIKYVIIILSVIVGIWLVNYVVKMFNENNKDIVLSDSIRESGDVYDRDYDTIQNTRKDTDQFKEETNIIKNFLDLCNEGKVEDAYNLLTDECKEVFYPDINIFKTQYIDKNFSGNKNYDYKVWTNNTYLIEIRDDIMATGIYSDSFYTEDYYTIINDKININGYVKRIVKNKEYVKDKIELVIESIDLFMDYTVCNIKIVNSNSCNIILDTKEKKDGIVLVDDNDLQYNYLSQELSEGDLLINKNQTKSLRLKFNISYRTDIKFTSIIFGNITEKSELAEDQYLKWGKIQVEI